MIWDFCGAFSGSHGAAITDGLQVWVAENDDPSKCSKNADPYFEWQLGLGFRVLCKFRADKTRRVGSKAGGSGAKS